MNIQWYPGHMTKAMRMMQEEIKLCDGVIYVLDARAPFACLNKKLEVLFNNKPVIYVLNKSDLVETADVNKVIKQFTNNGLNVVSCVGGDKRSAKNIYEKIMKSLKEKLEKNSLKGVFKPMRVMVAGIPNTGKSTIINTLFGSKRAETGDKAGVTKNKQWIKLYDIELLDTPGTCEPSFENQKYAEFLAFIGSLNDEILDMQEICYDLIAYLKDNYFENLKLKYSLNETDETKYDTLSIFNEICVKRGYICRGGEIDYERGSKAIIDDFRKGKIGKIILL